MKVWSSGVGTRSCVANSAAPDRRQAALALARRSSPAPSSAPNCSMSARRFSLSASSIIRPASTVSNATIKKIPIGRMRGYRANQRSTAPTPIEIRRAARKVWAPSYFVDRAVLHGSSLADKPLPSPQEAARNDELRRLLAPRTQHPPAHRSTAATIAGAEAMPASRLRTAKPFQPHAICRQCKAGQRRQQRPHWSGNSYASGNQA